MWRSLLFLGLLGCSAGSQPLMVLGAASTAEPLEASLAAWTARSGVGVRSSFASSSTLARQIGAGADAAVFLSASPRWADELRAEGLVAEASDLVGNRLVVIGAAGTSPPAWGPGFAAGFEGCLAIGDPAHVPGGAYAQAALESAGVWDAVSARVVPTVDAPSAVVLVERGECPVGLAYATDAAHARVVIGQPVPASASGPIVYPLMRLSTAAGQRPEAAALYAWLQSEDGLTSFFAAGFEGARDGR